MLDLSKKLIIGSLAGLMGITLISGIIIFIGVSHGLPDIKTANIFQLIFALVIMISSAGTLFVMHKDMGLENKHMIVLGFIFVMGLFYLVSSSIILDAINNPFSTTLTGAKAAVVLPGINAIISVPAIAGAGYLLAE